MNKFYNAQNDKVFKAVFVDPSEPELLETLLSLIFDSEVKDIKFDNPKVLKDNAIERSKTGTILANINGTLSRIDLNFKKTLNSRYKNASFPSIFIPNDKGNGYDIIKEIYYIDFAYDLNDDSSYVYDYTFMTKDKIKYTEHFHGLIFNMDKIAKEWKTVKNEREKQLYYYLSKFDMKEEELKVDNDDDSFVMKLKNKIKKLNEDKEFLNFLKLED